MRHVTVEDDSPLTERTTSMTLSDHDRVQRERLQGHLDRLRQATGSSTDGWSLLSAWHGRRPLDEEGYQALLAEYPIPDQPGALTVEDPYAGVTNTQLLIDYTASVAGAARLTIQIEHHLATRGDQPTIDGAGATAAAMRANRAQYDQRATALLTEILARMAG
jgi:hypothetical protein